MIRQKNNVSLSNNPYSYQGTILSNLKDKINSGGYSSITPYTDDQETSSLIDDIELPVLTSDLPLNPNVHNAGGNPPVNDSLPSREGLSPVVQEKADLEREKISRGLAENTMEEGTVITNGGFEPNEQLWRNVEQARKDLQGTNGENVYQFHQYGENDALKAGLGTFAGLALTALIGKKLGAELSDDAFGIMVGASFDAANDIDGQRRRAENIDYLKARGYVEQDIQAWIYSGDEKDLVRTLDHKQKYGRDDETEKRYFEEGDDLGNGTTAKFSGEYERKITYDPITGKATGYTDYIPVERDSDYYGDKGSGPKAFAGGAVRFQKPNGSFITLYRMNDGSFIDADGKQRKPISEGLTKTDENLEDIAKKILSDPDSSVAEREWATYQLRAGLESKRRRGDVPAKEFSELSRDARQTSQTIGSIEHMIELINQQEASGASLSGDFLKHHTNSLMNLFGFELGRNEESNDFYNYLIGEAETLTRELAEALKPVSEGELMVIRNSLMSGNYNAFRQSLAAVRNSLQRRNTGNREYMQDMGVSDEVLTRLYGDEQAGQPTVETRPKAPQKAPMGALQELYANPEAIDEFEEKYGYRPEGF